MSSIEELHSSFNQSEQQLLEGLSKKVLSIYGYPNNLDCFQQPFKNGYRVGFCVSAPNSVVNENDIICYTYTYFNSEENTWNFEEHWSCRN